MSIEYPLFLDPQSHYGGGGGGGGVGVFALSKNKQR